MKFFRHISVSEPRTPPDLYETIVGLSPAGRRSDFFFLEAKADDERNAQLVERILDLCEQRGLKRTRGETVGSYVYSVDRIYEPADLNAAALLLLVGGRGLLHDVTRDERGRLVLPATKARTSLKLAAAFPAPWIIVSDAVRQTLEAARLVGLVFGEVVLKGQSIRSAETPFWELGSSVTLPRMVNAVRYETSPFPCHGIDDGPYRRGEPHYRQSDLEALGDFDVAHTLEPLGNKDPRLIISHRLYEVCVKNKIPLEVWPVRIDPD